MSDVPMLKYVVLGPGDLDDLMTLLAKHYFSRENTYMSVGVTSATRRDEEDIKQCLESGVSVGSREQTTGRLVGVALSYIITSNSSWYTDEAKCSTQAEVTMARILNTTKSRVDLFQDPTVKQVLYMDIFCVHPDYGRQGVCKKLVQKCHDLGEERECQMAAGVMTSLYSQKLCSDLGYEDCATFHLNTVKETLLDLSTLNTTKFKIMTKYLSTKYKFTYKI
ncbi:uncharacterized protein [Cherax quadricarinatus]|uniref:uncharacterized protein n=1 Tax=Cherax quadricarinatus TaxID=27406 RepID=UPI00387E84E8